VNVENRGMSLELYTGIFSESYFVALFRKWIGGKKLVKRRPIRKSLEMFREEVVKI